MVERNKLGQDIIVIKKDKYYFSDKSGIKEINSKTYFTMGISLNGNSEYKSSLNEYSQKIRKGYTLLNIVNQDKAISQTPKDTHTQAVCLMIPKDFLEKNLPNNNMKDNFLNFLENGKGIQNISNQRTHPTTQALSLEIFNNPYTNNLEKLYTESKVLELIYTEFTNLFQQKETTSNITMKFSAQDKEAIYHAREILINNLQNPPTMKQLAKMVAINDLKLKVGFHKFFNETPYSVSLENRLQQAKKLLVNSDLNISEISLEVGYKYNSNFTKAFMKRFGMRPMDFVKSRKYY